jgi:hypothetical protein
MSFAEEANSDVPTLPASHSGIPTYLLDKARKAKEGIFEGRTEPQNERQRLPVVPQGIERDDFLKALAELQEQLGVEHLQINDKPLRDGWCVPQRPITPNIIADTTQVHGASVINSDSDSERHP